jgi:hypothetical protein
MKEKKHIRGSIILLSILVFLINITSIDSSAAELRDYKLPSQMSEQSYGRSWEATTPKSSSELPADVYDKFRQDVKKLTAQERKKLKVGFEEKAKKATNKIEKDYYSRLINILSELGIN